MAFCRTSLTLIAWAVGVAAAPALAADHPDLTGAWKLNEANRPAGSTGPREVVLTIQHHDPQFSYQAKGRQSNYVPFSEAYSFTTDGKAPAGDAKLKVVAQWKDEVLTTRYLLGGDEFMVVEYRLSADGKRLTRDPVLRGKPLGREVYDRQSPGTVTP
jgi:hypothetical protein